jgi:hypothetical protein
MAMMKKATKYTVIALNHTQIVNLSRKDHQFLLYNKAKVVIVLSKSLLC